MNNSVKPTQFVEEPKKPAEISKSLVELSLFSSTF